jgi:two-component system cell cycle sensor histidine kinase/response regulator CckA
VKDFGRQKGDPALDELPFAIWVGRAPTGEVLYTNDGFRNLLGLDHVARVDIGADAPVFYDRRGKPYANEDLPFTRALHAGQPIVMDDLVIHRGDGSRLWVRAFANPVRDRKGVVDRVVIAFTDITAEVDAQVDRAQVEKHLETAIFHAPVLLFVMDRDGVLTAAEGALRATLERGRQGMVGQSLFETYKDHPTVPGLMHRALAGETVSYSIEVQSLCMDVWLGPLRDAAGQLAGAIGVCTDVTEKRRLQNRLIQDDRVRAMGTTAASVAHEINNPLTYVLFGLESAGLELADLSTGLDRAFLTGDESATKSALRGIALAREYLGQAVAGADRIRQVTRDLSTFIRRDDERVAPIDVAAATRSAMKLVRKEIEARAQLIEDIGPSSYVLMNEARLVQVLVNLLVNAWQALPSPDPLRHVIGVRTGNENSQALIEIWDSGTGVPPQLREEIFEPFVTTKSVGAGTGLGLFVCRNIIHSSEGRITVHDGPNGGALFRIQLPVTRPPVKTLAPAAANDAQKDADVRRPRILIIEDDAMVARALASRVAGDLFEVRTVLDGRQGLDILLTDDRLDLAYCDVMMKDFTGIDLCEELERQSPQRVSKLVFMTGGAFTGRAQAFLEQRRYACVHKPFDIVADARRRVGIG